MIRYLGLAGALVSALLGPLESAAQTVRGQLLDAESGLPLEGGTLSLLRDTALAATAETDSAGGFSLTLERAGGFRVRAERAGYLSATSPPLRMAVGDTVEIEFRLSTAVVLLEPLVVTARARAPVGPLKDFYERVSRSISGSFITRDEIERRHPMRTTDLLRRIAGVTLTPARYGGGSVVTVRGGCVPTVHVDGTRVQMMGATIDDLVAPGDVEGIEVYKSSAEAPVQYQGLRAGCSVILIWTRHD